jgi:8-oxo-dGTP pyrophosphatase MutT (NUDIX family)
MSLKKFYVGVKGLIRAGSGFLILKHESGRYDIPGGRIDDDEDFEQTLRRELNEELPGIKDVKIGNMIGAYRLHKDIDQDTSLVLLYFSVEAILPEEIELSDEHTEYLWVSTRSEIPNATDPQLIALLQKLL